MVTLAGLLALFIPAVSASATTTTASPVDLALSPSTQTVGVGGTFTVVVQARCGTQSVDGIDLFLDFDSTHMAVQSATAGTLLPTTIVAPTWDNIAGSFDFSSGLITSPYLSGTFSVVSVVFQAKSVTTFPAPILFNTTGSRASMVDFKGENITGVLSGCHITVIPDAPLYLDPPEVAAIGSGQPFNMDIKTSVAGLQQVDAVQAYINFDPALLEVVDAAASQSGVQITPGTGLTSLVENTADNASGLISFTAGQPVSPYPAGSFTVATIRFKAKTVSGTTHTPVTVSLEGGSASRVMLGVATLPGAHADAAIQILPPANVNIRVFLQGARPDSGWIVPLTVKFFTPGTDGPTDILTAAPVYHFDLTTAKEGNTATSQATGVTIGVYDISVVSPHCLTNIKRAVAVTAPSCNVDMGTLLEGNANDDDWINLQDYDILAAAYGKGQGDSGYTAGADFNRSGRINVADFGLLVDNYNEVTPISIGSGGGGGGGTDTTKPTIVSVSPQADATEVAFNTPVSAVFSEAMKVGSITTGSFTLKRGLTDVAGAVTYDSTSNAAIFTPSVPLSPNITYTAAITTGVKDIAGNSLAASYSWIFTTATPGAVTAVTPPNNASNVVINASVSAIFSKDMDNATVTAASFTLKMGDTAVEGTVTYDSHNRAATFSPSSDLASNTSFTAALTTDIKDVSGNALSDPYSWSFTTGADRTIASINAPASVAHGEEFTVEIKIANVSHFIAYQLQVSYDNSVMQLVDSTGNPGVEGGQIGAIKIPLDMWKYVNDVPGSIRLLGHIPSTITANGQGYLARLHFMAIGSAGQSSNLIFTQTSLFNNYLFDNLFLSIPCQWENGVTNIVSMMAASTAAAATAADTAAADEAAAGTVDLVITPSTQTILAGATFTITVEAQSGPQDTCGIDVFLDYDPAHLTILSATPGSSLSKILASPTWDNTAGTFCFGAGQLESPFPSGAFSVVSVTFQAKNNTTSHTLVSFHTSEPGETMAIWGKEDITGVLAGGNYTILASPSVLTITPDTAAKGVAGSSSVVIAFSRAMDQSATGSAFSLSPSVAGNLSWNTDGTVMTFIPNTKLANGTTYTVSLSTTAVDTNGFPLNTVFSSTFTTHTISADLISSPNPSIYGQSVTFTASFGSDSGIPTGEVIFKEGNTLLGTGILNGGSPNSALVSISDLSTGTHFITAEYTGDSKYSGCVTDPVQQIVDIAALNITTDSIADSTLKAPYSQIFQAVRGQTPYKWSILKTPGESLPSGLTLDAASGILKGFPKKAGPFTFTVMVSDSAAPTASATRKFSMTVNTAITITNSAPAEAEIGVTFPTWILSAKGGSGPYTWSISKGALPDGLYLDESRGEIAGTPKGDLTAMARYSFTVQVTDSLEGWAVKSFTLKVYPSVSISTLSLPNDDIGVKYRQTLKAAGGKKKYTWSVISGSLPGGLELDQAKGIISGIPVEGTSRKWDFTVQADDGIGSAAQALSITVNEPLKISVDPEFTPGGTVGDKCNYVLTAGGGSGSGYKWALTGKLPTGLKFNAKMGTISGTLQKTGVYNFKIKLTDSLKGATIKEVTINVS
jgi:hypothetical protein